MVELLVVVLIVGILASLAVGVYTGQVQRARFAAARDLIYELELAVDRYQIDTGEYPGSGSGTLLAPTPITFRQAAGSGYMHLSLVKSMNGQASAPLSATWLGPYIELSDDQVGSLSGIRLRDILIQGGSLAAPQVQVLDPWDGAIYYIRSDEYSTFNGAPYPSNHPLLTPTETYYNPTTYQIISFGPDHIRNDGPNSDDVRNF